jgi:UDP-3-O-[3-hydroxymyristoyl] glucosamine N-acyltransferase LpxD
VPDKRFKVSLAEKQLIGLSGLRVIGKSEGIFQPVPLDQRGDETICFFQVRNAAKLAEVLSEGFIDSAVIAHVSLEASIKPALLAKFIKQNTLVLTANLTPKAIFSLLVEGQGPTDKGQLLLLSEPKSGAANKNCQISANATIAQSASIGEGSIVTSGAVIGDNVVVGKNCIIGESTMIYHDTILGDDVHIGPGSLIGSPVHANEQADIEAKFVDIPQIGTLRVGNNVRIGAQTVVNRGSLSDTVLGDHIRLGDRVNIGHNAHIGDRTWIAASSIVCGSSKIGQNVSVGIGAVIKNKMKVGENAMVGAGSVIISDVGANENTYPVPALAEKALLTLLRMIRKAGRR